MKLLDRILNGLEAAAKSAADFARMTSAPAKVPVPVKTPHLSYSLRRRKRLEWMNFVCRGGR